MHRRLVARGGTLLAVSADPPAVSRELAYDLALAFPILSDADLAVTRAYGLEHPGGAPDGRDIAIPAHLLVAPDGRIVWRRIARRIPDRPAPAEILAALEAL